MKQTIFIPKKIKVGYQHREDTYTQKLAYIIYFDNKGILRKETSWKGWIHDEERQGSRWNPETKKYVPFTLPGIPPDDYDNEPIEGFVLNKKAGGNSNGWNHRQTYCRVYDPRGFEFEITIPNLLYILENTSAIKGKGLEGKFVYGWDGKDLVLIPQESPEYVQMIEYTDKQDLSIKKSNLTPGLQYETKKCEIHTYLGYFPLYNRYDNYSYNTEQKPKKYHWFSKIDYTGKSEILTVSGLSSYAKKVSNDFDPKFPEYIKSLEYMSVFSPSERDELADIKDIDELIKRINNQRYDFFISSTDNTKLFNLTIYEYGDTGNYYFTNINEYELVGKKIERQHNSSPWRVRKSVWEYITIVENQEYTLEEILKLGIKIKKTYLKNGKERHN